MSLLSMSRHLRLLLPRLTAPYPPPRPFASVSSPASSTPPSSNDSATSTFRSPIWPLGTWDDPVPITSSSNTRVVGCTGRHDRPNGMHPTTWITVEKGKLAQCPTCQQVFELHVKE